MSRIDRSVLNTIRENPGAIVIQVTAKPEAVVNEALRRAIARIRKLDSRSSSAPGAGPNEPYSPKFVSGPNPADPGPIVFIDGGHTDTETLLTIPNIIVDELEAVGIRDARITSPGPAPLLDHRGGMVDVEPAVIMRLYPSPPVQPSGKLSRPPEEWLPRIWDWLWTESGEASEFAAIVWGTQFRMDGANTRLYLEQSWKGRGSRAFLVAGDPTVKLTVANAQILFGTLTLAVGGQSLTPLELEDASERLREVARRLAPDLSYACLSTGPLGMTISPMPHESRRRAPDAAAAESVRTLCDELAFDAYYTQILGPGHLARLKERPIGSTELDGGRVECVFGTIEDWLPFQSEGFMRIQSEARHVLGPCLVTNHEAAELWRRRLAPP